jgi:hypothetical protein
MIDKLFHHYRDICRPLLQGRVIPFLGSGVNLCDRPTEPDPADPEGKKTRLVPFAGKYLPSGKELTQHMVAECEYPADEPLDLMRVSQYASVMRSARYLKDELHQLFDRSECPITPLHRFLAGLPALRRRYNPQITRQLLIITTNYDHVLERAFDEPFNGPREPYDLVFYEAQENGGGAFRHRAPDGEVRPISQKSKSKCPDLLFLKERPVILKIHGTIIPGRDSGRDDSYVITEDHYIDFMAGRDILNLLPASVRELMMDHDTSFLFLGYGLRDWNMRVILRRIAREKKLGRSWAIEKERRDVDEKFWARDEISLVYSELREYIEGLQKQIESLIAAGGGA